MEIIPAIDLRDGKCVRLIQGRYDRQITYKDDPAEQAREFHADGAAWLHVVDLDGAKAGRPVNTEMIAAIASVAPPPSGGTADSQPGAAGLQVEVGGGIRDEASIRQLLDLGVTRVIIGTKAVDDFEWFTRMAEEFRGQIVLGLDARGDTVATHAWLCSTPAPGGDPSVPAEGGWATVLEFAAQADKLPLAAIIYTDISKDGMLCGPNIERTGTLVKAVKTPVIASGGVKEADDIRKLKPIGVAGVIVGRSLYEGTLTLKEALAAAK
ncbi:MAG: 1-(5-phosphoribosyl)-5-[(5-phosphoribosylamino)methylideneamino]imidazole-4-carboxamide isomerase [Sedimentisphaerales bacterium]|nr:1-(5-phosphoribosyl)-5-[(5-phosphoribosylamino)methylideneamino]imidazole-4-carboxamide isomerase [Sedimentisphaerales bacterium]